MITTGTCLCGGVRLQITEALGPIIYCHCSMCRRSSGTAFVAVASVKASGFHIVSGKELVSEYESSPQNHRAFCSRCGSHLYARNDSYPIVRVQLGTLDADPGGRCVAHIMVGSKAAWYEIADAVEQFEEFPPRRYFVPG